MVVTTDQAQFQAHGSFHPPPVWFFAKDLVFADNSSRCFKSFDCLNFEIYFLLLTIWSKICKSYVLFSPVKAKQNLEKCGKRVLKTILESGF